MVEDTILDVLNYIRGLLEDNEMSSFINKAYLGFDFINESKGKRRVEYHNYKYVFIIRSMIKHVFPKRLIPKTQARL